MADDSRPEPKLVTLNQLHTDTEDVIQELQDTRVPFMVTRHGRLLALVTALPDGIEGMLGENFLKRT